MLSVWLETHQDCWHTNHKWTTKINEDQRPLSSTFIHSGVGGTGLHNPSPMLRNSQTCTLHVYTSGFRRQNSWHCHHCHLNGQSDCRIDKDTIEKGGFTIELGFGHVSFMSTQLLRKKTLLDRYYCRCCIYDYVVMALSCCHGCSCSINWPCL